MAKKLNKAANKAVKTARETTEKIGKKAIDNPKTTMYAVLGVIGLVVVYKIVKGLKDTDDTLSLSLNLNNTTISNSEATNFAAQLLDAMNRYGTDEDLIEAVFDKLNNGDDFKYVAKKFGMVNYLNGGPGSPPEGLPDIIDGATPRNLVYWLQAELSTSDSVYQKVKSRVESAGFVFV